jgi:flagellar motor protein MotB
LQDALQELQTDLQEQLGPRKQTPEADFDLPTPLQPGEINMDVQGVITRIESEAVTYIFEDGLFCYGAVLRPEAEDRLTLLSQQLDTYAGQIEVIVIGFADDVESSIYSNPSKLSLMRANTVINHIISSTHLSVGTLRVILPVDRPAPYPNDTIVDRAHNRTVILILYLVGDNPGEGK